MKAKGIKKSNKQKEIKFKIKLSGTCLYIDVTNKSTKQYTKETKIANKNDFIEFSQKNLKSIDFKPFNKKYINGKNTTKKTFIYNKYHEK